MTTRPLNLDPIILAAHVAQTVRVAQRFAYAQLSPDLRILQASPKFLDLIDPSIEQPIGIFVDELLDEMFGTQDQLEAVLYSKIPHYRLEYINRPQPDGSIVYLTFHITPMDETKPHRGLLLLVEDTTESGRLQQRLVQDRNELQLLQDKLGKANRELQQLSRLKSLFLSMAAHDLRTPLTVAKLQVDMLTKQMLADLSPSQLDGLDMIRAQIEKLDRLINDLLDLDSLERGQLPLNPTEFTLNDLIQEVVKSMQILTQRTKQQIRVSFPTTLSMRADATRIWQIIYNLISNAIKYSREQGQVTIVGHQEEDEIVLYISDNGRGMTNEQMEQLFQPYYRTKEAVQSKIKGTGLGLYIVKMLVEAHNGRIEVESQPGYGTTFTLYFPINPTK